MTESNQGKKQKVEQISLSESSSRKIDQWLFQMPGLELTKKEIVNWLVERQLDELSSADISSLVNVFYSKEKFLQQLMKKSKQVKPAAGEQ